MRIAIRAMVLSWLVSVSAIASAQLTADQRLKDQAAAELAYIKNVFAMGYAPAEWKKKQFNWDLESEYQTSLATLAAKTSFTVLDYRHLISDFLRSTRDYHVGFQFVTTEKATLPFNVISVGDKYFVSWVNTEKVAKDSIRIGDQLTSFAGEDPAKLVLDLKTQMASGAATTDQRLAEMSLTRRSAGRILAVPQGRVDMVFKRSGPGGTEQSLPQQLQWEYVPEDVPMLNMMTLMDGGGATAPAHRSFLNPQMLWGSWDQDLDLEPSVDAPANGFTIGGRTSFVPALGQIIWETNDTETFRAYIYRHASGKLIGYIRIAHYSVDTPVFEEFKKLIARMKDTTDALVIDEVNNPGGSVFYVMALMSVLSDQPIQVPSHQVTLWPEMVSEIGDLQRKLSSVKSDEEARKALGQDKLNGYAVDYQLAQGILDYARTLQSEWAAGHKLTKSLDLYGVQKVNPDRDVNYTKPILVLINELDFSGGDFFPAILQDNKRAKIFGARTSGAGGYVIGVSMPSALGLKAFQFTGSIAKRLDGNPIENLGVTPDIPYNFTENDLRQGFSDYKNAVNKAVEEML